MCQWKKELRRKVLEEREGLGPEERGRKSAAVCRRLMDLLERKGIFREQGSLFTFMPFGHEVDILPVVQRCWEEGCTVVVPKTLPATKALELYAIRGMDELAPGLWGIPEPVEGTALADPALLQIALVPGVAFDRNGGRVGYGGGYYDRLLARLRDNGVRLFTIAPAFEFQLRGGLALEAHDVRVDAVATESAWYETEGGGTP